MGKSEPMQWLYQQHESTLESPARVHQPGFPNNTNSNPPLSPTTLHKFNNPNPHRLERAASAAPVQLRQRPAERCTTPTTPTLSSPPATPTRRTVSTPTSLRRAPNSSLRVTVVTQQTFRSALATPRGSSYVLVPAIPSNTNSSPAIPSFLIPSPMTTPTALSLAIPPPSLSPALVPRSLSPTPSSQAERPSSRSEMLLRETLERDFEALLRQRAKDREQESRPSSPLAWVANFNIGRQPSFEDEEQEDLRAHWPTTAPASTAVGMMRKASASVPPKMSRGHTLPTTSAPLPQSSRGRYTVSVPPPHLPQHHTTYISPPAHSTRDSVAQRRLERTLSKSNRRRAGSASNGSSQNITGGELLAHVELAKSVRRPKTADPERQRDREKQLAFGHRSGSLESTASMVKLYLGDHGQVTNPRQVPSFKSASTDPASTSSSPEEPSPFTPPPSPHFNPTIAGRHCAAIEGVVRFSDIEGLGVPPDFHLGEDDDEQACRHDCDEQRGRKWKWWSWR